MADDLATERLKDPVFRQACREIYGCAMLCFESEKPAVHAAAVCFLLRLGDLLFSTAQLANYSDEEIIEAGRKAHEIPSETQIVQ